MLAIRTQCRCHQRHCDTQLPSRQSSADFQQRNFAARTIDGPVREYFSQIMTLSFGLSSENYLGNSLYCIAEILQRAANYIDEVNGKRTQSRSEIKWIVSEKKNPLNTGPVWGRFAIAHRLTAYIQAFLERGYT